MVAAYVRGSDEKTRLLRRNIIRYCVLSQALVFRDISMRVRKRFPTIETLVAAGTFSFLFLTTTRCCMLQEIKIFRTNMAILCNFDWVPLPIMYPQLIVLAVHTYFLVAAVARQFIISEEALNKTPTDIYFPFMTVVQFVFYMGWLKVAEAMLNPFGEDDDDFECNFLLDKNLTIGLTIVDAGYNKTPALLKDVFWSEKQIEPLYSAQSAREEHRISGVTGSTANVKYQSNTSYKLFHILDQKNFGPQNFKFCKLICISYLSLYNQAKNLQIRGKRWIN
ncbi:unnamed protein product [Gongylonema pulchrum]|uniref:Bestrophin homolog n=1 Tax=Gongylonema pulchrum TaxID=637853 RepID=A0A183EL22_9BILA|nr:unnamed protein product [Gongylonema pulchrum]